MKNLAIIPARGGSKRIPRKNVKNFLGKPIIRYPIETALQSGLFDEIMVSTDDEEIANIAKRYGASVPFLRSDRTANDSATLNDVIEEVKEQYLQQNNLFDNICCILATTPLLTVEVLKRGLNLLIENEIDSVCPVVRFSYPIQRSFRMEKNGILNFFYPEYRQTRSQDLEPAFHDAGLFYWIRANIKLAGSTRYGFEVSEMDCQDIDNDTDWELAELKYKLSRRCSK